MKVLSIAANELRRTYRYKANVFFFVLLPLAIVMLLGAAFGNQEAKIGLVAPGTPAARDLAHDIAGVDKLSVVRFDTRAQLVSAVERGKVQGGVVIPPGFDRDLSGASTVKIVYYARPDNLGQQARLGVASQITKSDARFSAARFVLREGAASSMDAARTRVDRTAPFVQQVTVTVHSKGRSAISAFTSAASGELILFIFLSTLNAAFSLVEARRIGISRRVLSTPTSVRTLIAGHVVARYMIGLAQALIIVGGSILLFSVDFGDPLATAAVVASFALVATGISLLLGAVGKTEQQVSAVALLAALIMAAVGGSMAPLEVFSPAMRTVAHLTPHGWANDAFSHIINDRAGVTDIFGQIGVLLAMGVVSIALATHMLRRSITR